MDQVRAEATRDKLSTSTIGQAEEKKQCPNFDQLKKGSSSPPQVDFLGAIWKSRKRKCFFPEEISLWNIHFYFTVSNGLKWH